MPVVPGEVAFDVQTDCSAQLVSLPQDVGSVTQTGWVTERQQGLSASGGFGALPAPEPVEAVEGVLLQQGWLMHVPQECMPRCVASLAGAQTMTSSFGSPGGAGDGGAGGGRAGRAGVLA